MTLRSVLLLSLLAWVNTAVADCTVDNISGRVFRDFNYNGELEAQEPGVANVTISAVDSTGATIATATSDSTGKYELSVTPGTKVRLEFSGAPDFLKDGTHGSHSASSIQFSTSPSCDANFGVSNPVQYCGSDPEVAVPCYVYGDPVNWAGSVNEPHPGDLDWMVSFPYSRTGQWDIDGGASAPGPAWQSPNHISQGHILGTVWGLAYERSRNILFTSAFLKRGSDFGQLGPGGLYIVDLNNQSATNASYKSVVPWVDLNTIIPGSVGADPHDPLTGGLDEDLGAFMQVGKRSFGGLAISNDLSRLYVMNLNDRALVEIAIPAGNIPSAPTSSDVKIHDLLAAFNASGNTCVNGEFRPFAVSVHPDTGHVYVGGVCSAEYAAGTTNDLHAFIFSHNPQGAIGNFSLVYDFALNFPRHSEFTWSTSLAIDKWYPWEDSILNYAYNPTTTWVRNSSPILMDLAFDPYDDSLILGFNDRAGHQNGDEYPVNGISRRPITGGDIIRVCNVNGTFKLENNGSCPTSGVTAAGLSLGAGPGGGEYYWDDMYVRQDPSRGANVFHGHGDNLMGGLTVVPGTGEVMSTTSQPSVHQVFDPISMTFVAPNDTGPFYSGGVIRFDNKSGGAGGSATEPRKAYTLYDDEEMEKILRGSYPLLPAYFLLGKASGLGDIEVMCDEAPVEIGNRVWFDYNKNGQQDADEPCPIGATVNLYDKDGNQAGSTETSADCSYYFPVMPATEYRVCVDAAKDFAAGGVLYSHRLTSKDLGTSDLVDSDADGAAVGGCISLTSGLVGENNHSLDFGFYQAVCGDGVVDTDLGERCDDGNLVDNDGCSSTCVIERCGDGVIQLPRGEVCDDGNVTDGDGCNAQCLPEVCGDGIVQPGIGERCDDGNTTDGDGCSASCMEEACKNPSLDSDGDGIADCEDKCPNLADPTNPDVCTTACDPSDPECCTRNDQTSVQVELDQNAKKHERIVDAILTVLKNYGSEADVAFVNKQRPIVHKLQLRNWQISWLFPNIAVSCTEAAQGICVRISTEDLITEYDAHSKELHKIAKKAVRRALKIAPSDKEIKILKKLKKRSKKQDLASRALSDSMPREQDVCSN